MHGRLYNEAIFELSIRPRTPILIKAGGEGEAGIDPTLPNMAFVRTQRPGQGDPSVYIPGSSLRGVVRSHTEKLLRSIDTRLACDPTDTGGGGRGTIAKACPANNDKTRFGDDKGGLVKLDTLPGYDAYKRSCYACRLFGNTALAGRVRVGDLYPTAQPLREVRYGVAIDRVTGAVAQGPFELELVTDANFEGLLTVRNYTLPQFALIAATLLDLADGLVPMGYGKSRGLGRVDVHLDLSIRTLRDPQGAILGAGALADATVCDAYHLPTADQERIAVGQDVTLDRGGFYTLHATGQTARDWLDRAAPLWVTPAEQEASRG